MAYQIAATSLLLLACVHSSVSAHIPIQRGTDVGVQGSDTVANTTGTEAIHAKLGVDEYIKNGNDHFNVTAKCSALLDRINLPRPQIVPKCTSEDCMVNVSINLQYLLHMYSHVLGLVYQNSTADPDQMEQLDLLEMMYYRLFSQIQRYLQAHNLPSGHEIVNFTCSEEPKLDCTQDVDVVLCHLREMAIRAMDIISEKQNITLYGYKFCRSKEHVQCT